jgi:hypothetical protein
MGGMRIRTRARMAFLLGAAVLPGLALHGQGAATPAAAPTGRVVRTIEDPGTGARWLLICDANDPGGPGRLIAGKNTGTFANTGSLAAGGEPGKNKVHGSTVVHGNTIAAAVRAGDLLIVEEHTATAEAYLQGVAQAAAAVGSLVNVRLKAGGKLVRAVVLGPGRAALAPAAGVQR